MNIRPSEGTEVLLSLMCGRHNSKDAPSPKISAPWLRNQTLVLVLLGKDFAAIGPKSVDCNRDSIGGLDPDR